MNNSVSSLKPTSLDECEKSNGSKNDGSKAFDDGKHDAEECEAPKDEGQELFLDIEINDEYLNEHRSMMAQQGTPFSERYRALRDDDSQLSQDDEDLDELHAAMLSLCEDETCVSRVLGASNFYEMANMDKNISCDLSEEVFVRKGWREKYSYESMAGGVVVEKWNIRL